MVQILPQKPGLADYLSQGIRETFVPAVQSHLQQQLNQRQAQYQQSQLAQALQNYQQIQADPNLSDEQKLTAAYGIPGVGPQLAQQQIALRKAKNPKAPSGGVTAQPVPENIANDIEQVLKENQNATPSQLGVAFAKKKIPTIYSNSYVENARRQQEQQVGREEGIKTEKRKETLPLRTQLAEKAAAAEKGIQNKEQLIKLIKTGNINDPTFATLAQALPLNLGQRLLSPETVTYKAGLVDEFSDLRNIFTGQTRVKEIELLEAKIADIYLDDEQKMAVLNERLKALRADIIRAESASEVEEENPNLGVLQFEKAVNKKAKPRLDALFNDILEGHKSIIESAERRKQIPLDPKDPDDRKIMQQIFAEAGGDKLKAKKLAEEKGYKFKG